MPISGTILDYILYSTKEIINQGKILQYQILASKKVNFKYLSRFIKELIASEYL